MQRTEVTAFDPDVLPRMLDLGRAMLVAGADVHLVEGSIERMGRAYGATHVDALVITSSIFVTLTLPDGSEQTRTRRVDTTGETDFDKLERLNTLVTRCCAQPIPASDLKAEIEEICAKPFPREHLYLGGVISAGSFAVFFGGSWIDGGVAALFAVLICLMIERLKPLCPNNIVFNYLASLIVGLGIGGCSYLIPGLDYHMVMIGDIMLLIPGVMMTNSVRDLLSGDTISGSMRFTESALWACALALGFMTAILLTGVK